MLLLPSVFVLVVANTADPAERGGQVDGSVLVLDHGRDQRLEVRPRGVFVPCALHHWIAHGAQQAQRPDVTVQDVDRPEAPLEAVELQQSHALGRGVGLLVQTRVVPEDQHLPVGDVQLLEATGLSSPKCLEVSRYPSSSQTSERSLFSGSG